MAWFWVRRATLPWMARSFQKRFDVGFAGKEVGRATAWYGTGYAPRSIDIGPFRYGWSSGAAETLRTSSRSFGVAGIRCWCQP